MRWRVRLWVKLAIFAALGVVVTHVLHLTVGTRVATDALSREQESLGRSIAGLVARQAADAVLVEDSVTLHELANGAVSGQDVAYCLILREGHVLASSFPGGPPASLLTARADGKSGPIVVKSGAERYLDLVEPILDGGAGEVRIGLDMGILRSTRLQVFAVLGTLALVVTLAGFVAAFLVGRSIALPLGEIVEAADQFDPSRPARLVEPRGSDEIRELTERFNGMMVRLHAAHDEQARARNQQADTERMAALGKLVAGVAHEVNNPLAGLKNCLRRLQRGDAAGSPKHAEYLELMDEGLERIEDAMKSLLDLARPRPLQLREVDAHEVVREGTSLLRPLLERRRIAIRAEEADARVLADPKQAGQALLNLLLNAAYVTEDGGEIRLRFRERPGFLGIAVEDDGPGIPEALRQRVLDPFFSTKPEGEGTGLGLSVTKSILDAHGGELTLDCPGHGTAAVLWLRSAPAAAS